MKKILFWSAVTVLAAVSCNKIENDAPVQESNVPEFVATVDGANTKTVLDGMKSYWNGIEGIRVLDGTVSKVYTATVEKAETATFEEKDATALSGNDYLALYPEGPAGSVAWDGDIENAAKKFWLPGDQTATEGSYDPSTHIAVAYTEAGNNNLEFKNVTSLIKVEVANDDVTEICFYGNKQEKISGNFDVLYNGGEPTASVEGYDANGYAKITGDIKKGSVYYISILPCTFTEGFTIEFAIGGTKYTKSMSSEFVVGRNQVVTLPVVEFEIQEMETTTIYMLPTNSMVESGNRFAAYCFGENAVATWYDMTDSDSDGIYEVELPTSFDNVIFCSMKSSTTVNDWNNKVDQTGDLIMPTDDKVCYISYSGSWVTLAEAKEFEEPDKVCRLTVRVNKSINWYDKYLYSWTSGTNAGNGMGVKLDWDKEDGSYYVYYHDFSYSLNGQSIDFNINNGSWGKGNQTVNLSVTLSEKCSITIETKDVQNW